MKEIFLSELCGFWYFFDRSTVRLALAVAATPRPVTKMGQSWFVTEDGNVEICPLHLIFNWSAPDDRDDDHFLVLVHAGRLLALPMHGEGRECMADLRDLAPLPPAFAGLSRRIIPGLLLNGEQVIMGLDLNELVNAMDKVTYLRKQKLLSRQRPEV